MRFAGLLFLTALAAAAQADVTGHVTGSDARTEIHILAPGFVGKGSQFETRVTKPDARGNFAFKNVPAEFSILEASSWHGKNLNYAWAERKGEPLNLAMTTVKPLVGRVVVEGPLPRGIVVTLPGDISTPVGADGRFNLAILLPNWYEVQVEHLPPGYAVQGVKRGDRKLVDGQIDLRRSSGELLISIAKLK